MMIKSKLPKLKFALFGLLVLLLALSPVTSVVAQGLGHGFYGTVKIGGEDAEIDTVISARVAETEYGSCQVATLGQYALIVQGEIEDSATINFYINGQEADQTFSFHDGWTTKLDLTVAEAEPEPEPEIAPTVVTNTASALTTTSTTLNANLTVLGTASSVEVSFEWGTTDAYGNTATVTASPLNAPSVFSASLSGLSPSTTYHFIAKAVGDGTSYGADRTLTTSAEPAPAPAAPPAPPAGTTDVRGMITTAGVFLESVTVTSDDELCTLDIPEGTVGLTEELEPLDEITVVIMDEPPDPPEDADIVLAYDLGPDGATFEPAITLTFSYDPADIPEGRDVLVVAYYDEIAEAWVYLEGEVDTVTKTITVSISHFTTFAVIGRAPPEEEEVPIVVPPVEEEEEEEVVEVVEEVVEEVVILPEPAAFSVSNLSISPRLEVQTSETVTISVAVANTGDESGSYTVVLKIDGVKEAEETVTVAAGEDQNVSFSVTREDPGDYTVDVDGLSGSFTVVLPVEPPGVNWPLNGGIIAAVVIVAGLLIYLLIRRRAY